MGRGSGKRQGGSGAYGQGGSRGRGGRGRGRGGRGGRGGGRGRGGSKSREGDVGDFVWGGRGTAQTQMTEAVAPARWWVTKSGVEVYEEGLFDEPVSPPDRVFRYVENTRGSSKKKKKKRASDFDLSSDSDSDEVGDAPPFDYVATATPPSPRILGLDFGHTAKMRAMNPSPTEGSEGDLDSETTVGGGVGVAFAATMNAATRETGRLAFLPAGIKMENGPKGALSVEFSEPRKPREGVSVSRSVGGKKKKKKKFVGYAHGSDEDMTDDVYQDFINNCSSDGMEHLLQFASQPIGQQAAVFSDSSSGDESNAVRSLPPSGIRQGQRKQKRRAILQTPGTLAGTGSALTTPATSKQVTDWATPTSHPRFYLDPLSIHTTTFVAASQTTVTRKESADRNEDHMDTREAEDDTNEDESDSQSEGSDDSTEEGDDSDEDDGNEEDDTSEVAPSGGGDEVMARQLDSLVNDLLANLQTNDPPTHENDLLGELARDTQFHTITPGAQDILMGQAPTRPPGFQKRLAAARSYNTAISMQDAELLVNTPAYESMLKRMGKKAKMATQQPSGDEGASDRSGQRPKGGWPGSNKKTAKREKKALKAAAKKKGSKRAKGAPPQQPGEVRVIGGRPIADDNIGNKMLRSMGWAPGTGLGAARSGIQQPVMATLRPRNLGLGN